MMAQEKSDRKHKANPTAEEIQSLNSMYSIVKFTAFSLLVSAASGFSFHSPSKSARVEAGKELDRTSSESSRRVFVEQVAKGAVSLGIVPALISVAPQPVLASGGATAGGAYLLSAKQRYNDRVKKAVVEFLALKAPLEAGDINALRDYFSSEDAGSWKDFTSAGYLLANAFRRNSSAAPDTLPSVKAWKKFASDVEGMTKALKKKDTAGALAAFNSASTDLDDYLAKVELPPSAEISSS